MSIDTAALRAALAKMDRAPWRYHVQQEHVYSRWNEDDERVVYMRGQGGALCVLRNETEAILDSLDATRLQLREAREENERMHSILTDLLRYRRGLGEYDFSRLGGQDRDTAVAEAWEALESRTVAVRAALKEGGRG